MGGPVSYVISALKLAPPNSAMMQTAVTDGRIISHGKWWLFPSPSRSLPIPTIDSMLVPFPWDFLSMWYPISRVCRLCSRSNRNFISTGISAVYCLMQWLRIMFRCCSWTHGWFTVCGCPQLIFLGVTRCVCQVLATVRCELLWLGVDCRCD